MKIDYQATLCLNVGALNQAIRDFSERGYDVQQIVPFGGGLVLLVNNRRTAEAEAHRNHIRKMSL